MTGFQSLVVVAVCWCIISYNVLLSAEVQQSEKVFVISIYLRILKSSSSCLTKLECSVFYKFLHKEKIFLIFYWKLINWKENDMLVLIKNLFIFNLLVSFTSKSFKLQSTALLLNTKFQKDWITIRKNYCTIAETKCRWSIQLLLIT